MFWRENVSFNGVVEAGTSKNDTLEGTNKRDSLRGRDGSDVLLGNGGADRLDGGNGNDTLDGGNGDDLIIPGLSFGRGDVIVGSKGDDEIDLSDGGSAYRIDYSENSEGIDANLKAESGTIDKGDDGEDRVTGLTAVSGAGGLTIIGSAHDDRLKAALDAESFVRFTGGAGNDKFYGKGRNVQVEFVENGDTGVSVEVTRYKDGFMTGKATDAFGDTDRFYVVNELRGTDADDQFQGAVGKDRFVTGEGNDIVDGGGGIDQVRYNHAGVESVDIDLRKETATIEMTGATYTDTLVSVENISGSNAGDDDIRGGDENNRFFAYAGEDLLRGGDGNDEMYGGDGKDTLKGGDNRDDLYGEGGKDELDGGKGRDRLYGGNSKDTLSGGAGDDTLEGGSGDDVFEFGKKDEGTDLIVDFEDGDDLIEISSGANEFSDLKIRSNDGDAKVMFGDVVIVLEDIKKSALTDDDFFFT